MKYRYYSTERPVAPGTFPKKPGCEISNYPQKFFIDKAAVHAWGHIDYNEPLTDQEIADYELKAEPFEFSVTFRVTNEQVGRLHKLLPEWQNWESEDGGKPFKDYDIEKLFNVIMQTGSFHTINNHIEAEEYRKGCN